MASGPIHMLGLSMNEALISYLYLQEGLMRPFIFSRFASTGPSFPTQSARRQTRPILMNSSVKEPRDDT